MRRGAAQLGLDPKTVRSDFESPSGKPVVMLAIAVQRRPRPVVDIWFTGLLAPPLTQL